MNKPKMKSFAVVLAALSAPGLVFAADAAEYQQKAEQKMDEAAENTEEGALQAELEATFAADSELSAYDIDTEVVGDKAVLNGQVKSDAIKELAEEKTKNIDGIAEVENNIEVNEDLQASKEGRETGNEPGSMSQNIADAAITASVKSQLIGSDVLARNIDVDTHNGRVTLSGVVQSDAHSELAQSIAEDTDDVAEVENNLTVDEEMAQR